MSDNRRTPYSDGYEAGRGSDAALDYSVEHDGPADAYADREYVEALDAGPDRYAEASDVDRLAFARGFRAGVYDKITGR